MKNFKRIVAILLSVLLLTATSISFSADGEITYPRVADPSSLLVGSWGTGRDNPGQPAEWISLTFYPNGTYIHWESDDPSNPDDEGGGVEYGTYTYNPSTGVVTGYSIVDENGDVGLNVYGESVSFPVTVTEDALTAIDPYDGSSITLPRVADDSSLLVGSWGQVATIRAKRPSGSA